jgi:hypothetical protein
MTQQQHSFGVQHVLGFRPLVWFTSRILQERVDQYVKCSHCSMHLVHGEAHRAGRIAAGVQQQPVHPDTISMLLQNCDNLAVQATTQHAYRL